MDSATENGAAAGAAVADRAGLRRGSPQPGGRRPGAGVEEQRLQMARAVSRPPLAGLDRRAAARRAAEGDRRSDRRRDHPHARGAPTHATQWTTRSLADVAGLSKATISRIWQTFGLQSHRIDTFKLSADPQFVAVVRDLIGRS